VIANSGVDSACNPNYPEPKDSPFDDARRLSIKNFPTSEGYKNLYFTSASHNEGGTRLFNNENLD
jgi:hypothetical protein